MRSSRNEMSEQFLDVWLPTNGVYFQSRDQMSYVCLLHKAEIQYESFIENGFIQYEVCHYLCDNPDIEENFEQVLEEYETSPSWRQINYEEAHEALIPFLMPTANAA
jgi:hypothetical protein